MLLLQGPGIFFSLKDWNQVLYCFRNNVEIRVNRFDNPVNPLDEIEQYCILHAQLWFGEGILLFGLVMFGLVFTTFYNI